MTWAALREWDRGQSLPAVLTAVSTQVVPARVFSCRAVLTTNMFAQVNRDIPGFNSRQL